MKHILNNWKEIIYMLPNKPNNMLLFINIETKMLLFVVIYIAIN